VPRDEWIGPVLRALGIALALGTAAAHAEGIDCSKARSAVEKAICASPALLALDRSIAVAYAGTLAQHPDRADTMRRDLLRWLRERDAACAVPAAQLPQCLTGQLTARLAALAPPPANAPAPTTAPAPPPAAAVEVPPPPEPAVPSQANPPTAAASLDATTLPPAAEADTKLHVTSAGRFAVALHSATGAALQFVDMLTGPSALSGEAGAQDGRLDLLLDQGTYKLRAFAAPGAAGEIGVSVGAFRDAAPPRALPPPGRLFSADLHDLEQRAFWLAVRPAPGAADATTGEIRIEAAGRSLADLRLWRNGAELTTLEPEIRSITPVPGHPLADLRLTGLVPAGIYLVIAYGGPSLPWADGAAAQPFHLRSGAAGALAEGWAGGRIGPLGSEVFTGPAAASLVVLDLPQAAAAELHADGRTETIALNSRAPRASLRTASGRAGVIEIRGAEGQPFTLRAVEQPLTRDFDRPGAWWFAAVATSAGGDEVPPAVLLERNDIQSPARIVAASLPKLAAGAPWRQRFNLRGSTTLLFENTYSGEIQTRGGAAPIGSINPSVLQENLPSGYLALRLQPPPGAQGVVDLVVGPPGPAPAPAPVYPADPVLPLGVQTLLPGQRLHLYAGDAPGVVTGLLVRPAPVPLAEGPLTVTQLPGVAVQVPVQLVPGGSLGAVEIGGGEVAVTLAETPGGLLATLPAPARARSVVLSWRLPPGPPADVPPPPPAGSATPLLAGTPVYFDLVAHEQQSFTLSVAEGGLYRLETLGRLRTNGRIATSFIADLDQAEANGIGQNMLIQRWLRAGRYRVDVAADASVGHVGLSASRAPLLAGAELLPGGSVRARLPAGTGIVFPVAIAEAGSYRLEVAGLGRGFTTRLDDAEGWPMLTPGAEAVDLQPGRYRLLVSPEAVEALVVARLAAEPAAAEITGHGPHPLEFDSTVQATWREPPGRDTPRTPDSWQFALAGPASVKLEISDGMVAELRAEASPPDQKLARITGRYTGRLPAGRYRVEAASLGRNDRLDYTLKLGSQELQPDRPRQLSLPAHVPFAIEQARVVSLTSFGREPVNAVLRRADGSVVARYGAREDDWNIAVSRLLAPGAYTLDLAAAVPPGGGQPVSPPDRSPPRAAEPESPDDAGSDSEEVPAAERQHPQTSATHDPGEDSSATSEDAAAEAEAGAKPKVELRLSLPQARPPEPAPAQTASLEGGGVHVLTLDPPLPGQLLTAAALSSSALVLTLERQDPAGAWQVVALDQGLAPVVAVPADPQNRPWRAEIWPVDGGSVAIRVAARAVAASGLPSGQTPLTAVEGMPFPLALAHLVLPAPGVLTLQPVPDGLLAGGWPGHALAPVHGGLLIPQGTEAWLLARGAAPAIAALPLLAAAGSPVALSLPAGAQAVLPAGPPDAGSVRAWLAESGLGQPGIEAGRGMGAAAGSALALGAAPPVIRNAGSDTALPLLVTPLSLRLLAAQTPAGPVSLVLPGHTALPLRLPDGDKRLQADLATGTAVVAGWQGGEALTAWAGAAALSRVARGAWTEVLLVNTGSQPAPVALSFVPAPPEPALRPGMVEKRFFGAAGAFDRRLEPGEGARLVLAGDAEATVLFADGRIRRGRSIALDGPGRAVITHGVGALALWTDAPGRSPWPPAAPQPVSLPARLVLSGEAMALRLAPDSPVLLHATSTAPVLLALAQGERPAAPELFPAGAEWHRALVAGPAELRLYSPHDGPLAGTLELSAQPVTPVTEGLGPTVTIAPGGSAVFGFHLAKAATIGLGVRAEPDDAEVRVLDATGLVLGEGVAQLRALPAGSYLLEARVPPAGVTTLLRPAVIGITPRDAGPPAEVARHYLELVGLAPQGDAP
jgi:uncharacterized protein YecT (DUF1311 family)